VCALFPMMILAYVADVEEAEVEVQKTFVDKR
jgi:hypothetical protein